MSLPVDLSMITDESTDGFVSTLADCTVTDAKKVVVLIGHDTPNSTVEVGAAQRKLIRFALDRGIALESCQGIGYLRMLEAYCGKNQVIAGCGRHMAGFGAVGSLGIQVTEAQLADCMATNKIDITIPEIFTINLTGALMDAVSMSDAALTLLHLLPREAVINKLVVMTGEALGRLTVHERYDLCHLMNVAGAFSALISEGADQGAPDFTLALQDIKPVLALPGDICRIGSFGGTAPVTVNEVFIGGCRGGKIEDLRAAAAAVQGNKIAYRVRMVVAPATSETYIQAIQEGLLQIFLDFGAVVMNQGCSVCWGKAQGYLDDGEVLVSTGSYNHAGCCGSPKANVYLVSPVVAAQCAITGVLQK